MTNPITNHGKELLIITFECKHEFPLLDIPKPELHEVIKAIINDINELERKVDEACAERYSIQEYEESKLNRYYDEVTRKWVNDDELGRDNDDDS